MLVQRKGNILVRRALTVIEKKEENEDKEQKFKAPFFLFWGGGDANTGPVK